MSLWPSKCDAIKEPASAPQKPSWESPGVLFTQILGPQLSAPGLGWGSASLPFLTSCQVPASALLVHSLPLNSPALWCQDGDTAPLPMLRYCKKSSKRTKSKKRNSFFSECGRKSLLKEWMQKKMWTSARTHKYVCLCIICFKCLFYFTKKISFNLIKSYAIFN